MCNVCIHDNEDYDDHCLICNVLSTNAQDLECPDRVLIGGEESDEGRAAIQALVDVSSVFLMTMMVLTMVVLVRIVELSRLL